MIHLITGLPGNGKTCIALAHVKKWAEKDTRPVFYSGINLTDKGREVLGWQEIEAKDWMDCPTGSIIVIDECQRVFRPRANGVTPPSHVAELETHRHKGVDIVLITQHPMLVDNAVRRLAGKHWHIVRRNGFATATVHEWQEVRIDCEKRRDDSEKTTRDYDKQIYELYTSAEIHTVKKQIPKRAIMVAVSMLVVAGLGFAAYFALFGRETAVDKLAQPGPASSQRTVPAADMRGGPDREAFDPYADARKFVYVNTPRIEGMQHTAPRYDRLTEPKYVPVPAMCIRTAKRCTCYSQQGTMLDVTEGQCAEFVIKGYFVEFDLPVPGEQAPKASEPQQITLTLPNQTQAAKQL